MMKLRKDLLEAPMFSRAESKTSASTKNGTFIFVQLAKCLPPLAMSALITRSATRFFFDVLAHQDREAQVSRWRE
jgi:hypothetical protein